MCTLTHTLSYPVCTQLGINKQHIIQKVGPRVGVTGVLLVDTCFFKINKYLVIINKVW